MRKQASLALIILAITVWNTGAATADVGKSTYDKACRQCHNTGFWGAPKIGDKKAWAPHIAKGMDTLYDHALNGYMMMAAKGGKKSLPDNDVKAAVRFIVDHSR